MQLAREFIRHLAFLDHIKAAAVHHPDLRSLPGIQQRFLFLTQTRVEPGEVISRAHPHDAGKHVHPAGNKVEPFADSWINHCWFCGKAFNLFSTAEPKKAEVCATK